MSRIPLHADNEMQFFIDTTAGGNYDGSGSIGTGNTYASAAGDVVLTLPGNTVSLTAAQFMANIIDGSIENEVHQDSDQASSFTLKIIWDDQFALTHFFLTANCRLIKGPGGNGYWIWRGWRSPLFSNQFCVGVKTKPLEPCLAALAFDYAMMTLYFRSQPIQAVMYTGLVSADTSPGPKCAIDFQIDLQPSGEVITVPGSAASFTVGGNALDQSQTVFYPLLRYSIRLKNMITMPLAPAMKLMNTVNSTPLPVQLGPAFTQFTGGVASPVMYMPPEFALFEGISDIHQRVSPIGTFIYDYEYTWLISPINFNYVFNPALITGGTAGADASGYTIGSPTATAPTAGTGSPVMISFGSSKPFAGSNPTNWPFVRPDQQKYAIADHAGHDGNTDSLLLYAIFAPTGS